MLIVLGLLKFGFVANFLSHPVVSGFITASGIIIALGQLGPLMGVSIKGDTLPHLLDDLGSHWVDAHGLTTLIGVCAIGFLLFSRYALTCLLMASGMSERAASLFVRAAPVVTMVVVFPFLTCRALRNRACQWSALFPPASLRSASRIWIGFC